MGMPDGGDTDAFNAVLARALALHSRLEGELGALPAVVCLNKRDLPGWSLDPGAPELARYAVVETSAADGRGVERAFAHLAAAPAL